MHSRAEFVVAAVAGVTLTRWTRAWGERRPDRPLRVVRIDESEQNTAVVHGGADMVFARRPTDTGGLSAIPLYDEVQVVVAPVGHVFEAVDEVATVDLAGENQLEGALRDSGAEAAIELVATGIGVVVVPHSIARLFARRDVVARPVTDAAPTPIALVWVTAALNDDIEDFIGIVRGRTAHSSRSVPPPPKERSKESKKANQRTGTPPGKRSPSSRPTLRRKRQGR
ncbi:MAG: hypothetical protein RI885_90 [Actinomycetota bacterium]|jgi:DNA-binding transcriptional LysR family regulator